MLASTPAGRYEVPPPPKYAEKKLFTPGPLGVSETTKRAMMYDLGSRDAQFIALVKRIRSRLVAIAQLDERYYTTVPVQGSGTFAVEATITSSVPRENGKLLVISNGRYAQRIAQIARYIGVEVVLLEFPEHKRVDPAAVEAELQRHCDDRGRSSLTNVAIVHCETTTGIINPVEEVSRLVRLHAPRALLIVDGMSAFGAVPTHWHAARGSGEQSGSPPFDFMVSSANKCLEGVPGFAFVIALRSALDRCKGLSRSMSLDLYEQYKGLEQQGQFRFTPPTHAMLALDRALDELDAEGGPQARAARYTANARTLRHGMKAMGFKEFLGEEEGRGGFVITSYLYPPSPAFSFERFYSALSERGFCIYPGKVTEADCFRIGSIGHLFEGDMEALLSAIREVCAVLGIVLPLQDEGKS